jgi:hypothetical protein
MIVITQNSITNVACYWCFHHPHNTKIIVELEHRKQVANLTSHLLGIIHTFLPKENILNDHDHPHNTKTIAKLKHKKQVANIISHLLELTHLCSFPMKVPLMTMIATFKKLQNFHVV